VIDLQRRAVAERAQVPLDEEIEGGEEAWLDDLSMPPALARSSPGMEQPRGGPGAAPFLGGLRTLPDRLPKTGRRVFFLREVVGEETDAICKAEGITPSNCWVILHRARISLRTCLEKHWFGKEVARAG
jgi:RNA polymerase sigma-70 factor (ECF subfamily)